MKSRKPATFHGIADGPASPVVATGAEFRIGTAEQHDAHAAQVEALCSIDRSAAST